MLEVVRTQLAQHATCRECGSEHVFALRHQWTLVHPSGTVLSFASAKALRRALTDAANEDGDDDLEASPAVRDDLDLVSISEPPRIAPIPPVPSADGTITLQPPPPPRRPSSHPSVPIAAAVSTTESEAAGATPTVLPKPSPLPPPSEPASLVGAETMLGPDEPPVSEPVISLRTRIERGSRDDLVDDVNGERTSGLEEAPRLDDAPSVEGDVNVAETSSTFVSPRTTRAPSASSLADTVKRRRWSEDDEQAFAIVPPPRRGGWAVAVGLVAAAAGLVVYLHKTSANVPVPGSAATVAATSTVAASTDALAMPAMPMNEAPAATTSMAAPSKLGVAPEPALPVLGTSLVPLGAMPVSVTTTTNATTAIDMAPAAARGPTLAPLAPAEPVSEDLLPTSELLRRAHASLTNGDRPRAQQRFRLALAKDPGNVEATTGLGDIARSEGDLDTARERYQRALERSPSFVPALLALADLDWERGRQSDARSRYTAIVDKLGDQAPERAKERKGDVPSSP